MKRVDNAVDEINNNYKNTEKNTWCKCKVK